MMRTHGRTAKAQSGEVVMMQQQRRNLALQNVLRGSHTPTAITTGTRHSITVQNLSEPVTDPRLRVRRSSGGPRAAWLLGGVAATTAEELAAAAAGPTDDTADNEELVNPVMRELFQMYRVRVRGWFEAVRFTRRSLFVILVVFIDQDPISRQVGVATALCLWDSRLLCCGALVFTGYLVGLASGRLVRWYGCCTWSGGAVHAVGGVLVLVDVLATVLVRGGQLPVHCRRGLSLHRRGRRDLLR